MKKLLFIYFCLLFLFTPVQTHAQEQDPLAEFPQTIPVSSEGWYINSFETHIALEQNGLVSIQEKIIVDFKDLDKHGIFRDIPIIYRGSENEIYTEIDVQNILQDGKKAKFEEYRNGDFIELKIGDPDKTISEIHEYQIDYKAKGVLRGFSGYDELYWNITGNDWPVPILAASALISFPQDGILKYKCFEGPTGSQITQCNIHEQSKKELSVTTSRSLNAYEGLTAVIGYKPGMVPVLVVEKPKTMFEQFISPSSLITLGAGLFVGLFGVILLWWNKGRDFWFETKHLFDPNAKERIKPFGAHETIVVEYTPPEKLRPAELGVLVDEKADTLDVTATIIDLATRGFLSIKEIQKKWVFGKTDYELTKKNKSQTELRPYEKELMDRLFDDGNTVKISELKKKFYTDLAKVKTQLYKDVQDKKLFAENPETARGKYLAGGIILIVIGAVGFGMMTGNQFVYGIDLAIALVATGIFLFIFSFKMPRRTAIGRELYRRVKGYQLFISTAEKHKQKFLEDKNLFNEVLPYVIVFGLTEKFAKAMKEIGVKPDNTVWYSGAHPFNVSTFSSNVSNFSNSFSNAIASTPSSSGGFSGGGSSGGGFGGGGGGSW